jgi:hypothetical protein
MAVAKIKLWTNKFSIAVEEPTTSKLLNSLLCGVSACIALSLVSPS